MEVRSTGFPHSDTSGCSRLHTPDRSFSQCTASFIGAGRPGIPRVPLFAAVYSNILRFSARFDTENQMLATDYSRGDFTCFSVFRFLS